VPLSTSFYTEDEAAVAAEFLERGYVIRPVDDRAALDELRGEVVAIVCEQLGRKVPNDHGAFLDNIHEELPVSDLNRVRLALYHAMNAKEWFRPTYFRLGRSHLERLVGNELAMQNRINFSIQLPEDDSSLLDIHADVYGGETPFQVVQWLPLVDVFDSKAMFFLPRAKTEAIVPRLVELGDGGMDQLYKLVEPDLIWLPVPYGSTLIFSPNNLHGNIVNHTVTSRWSMNCRFTGLFTPYTSAEKKIGSYYLPITTRAVSRVGMSYRYPSGFSE